MLDSDELALALAENFYSAALGAESWYKALEAFAAATGSRTGELITIGADASVPINLMTNIDPEIDKAFVAVRGGDPNFNPRVRAGMVSPVLKVLAENDFMTCEEHKVHPHYQEFARPWDIPYICLSTLDRRDGLLVGLAVCRSEREGHISDQQRKVFAAIAPHVRAAVRMQMALEDQGTALLSGVFESLALPAVVCDRYGRIRALTPAAEAIVAQGAVLRVKGGKLLAVHDEDSTALSAAIQAAADAPGLAMRAPHTVIARATRPDDPAVALSVLRLPVRSLELTAGHILIVPQSAGDSAGRRRALLQTAYELTAAEIEVALQLSKGRSAEAIAANRCVAIATVRAQIKSILSKFGITRQVELVAKIAQL